jgi:hypothetical protein
MVRETCNKHGAPKIHEKSIHTVGGFRDWMDSCCCKEGIYWTHQNSYVALVQIFTGMMSHV